MKKTNSSGYKPIEEFPVRLVGQRDWGMEILIAQTDDYIGKVLVMKAGCGGGLQYHNRKDETFYLHEGQAEVTWDRDGELITAVMVKGQSFHVPPGAPHRVKALTDCIFFEASTPVFDDRVRVENEYGLSGQDEGLQTTS